MTFEEVCNYYGWEPQAVRALLESGKEYKIKVSSIKTSDKEKAKCMEKIFKNK